MYKEYDHELDYKPSLGVQLHKSRAETKGEKHLKKYLRNQAGNYTNKPEVRKYILERDNYKCVFCGSQDNLELDHILSVYMGGKNKICNLQTLCKSCNAGKSVHYMPGSGLND